MEVGGSETRDLATPLFSASQPAGSHQQVMSPTQGYGTVTHAVYGLRESPKLWSDFRDSQLLNLRCVVNGVELLKGKL